MGEIGTVRYGTVQVRYGTVRYGTVQVRFGSSTVRFRYGTVRVRRGGGHAGHPQDAGVDISQ